MGKMIFSTKDKDVVVHRSLHLIDGMLRKTTWGLFRYGGLNLCLSSEDYKAIKTLTDSFYIQDACDKKDSRVLQYLASYLSVGDGLYGGREQTYLIKHNTAILMGGDLLRFLSYLSLACEVHGYIHEDDKLYFADILEQGIRGNVLPKTVWKENVSSGWEEVIGMLKDSAGHVVLSHSGGDVFPGGSYDGYSDWGDLSHEERWDYAMGELLKDKEMRIYRDCKKRLGEGVTILDINKQIEDFILTLKD